MRRITAAAVRRRASRYRAILAPKRRLRRLLGLPHDYALPGDTHGPADFGAWLNRIGGRNVAGYPESWNTTGLLSPAHPTKVAAVVHCYFPELLPEVLVSLGSIPVAFDLLVTNASGAPLEIDRNSVPNLHDVRVFDVANRGRDILPLVYLANSGALDPYELLVKVHTKKSEWRQGHQLSGTGEEWRSRLLGDLLGSSENVTSILDRFATDPHLGVLTARGSKHGPEMWGDNQPTVRTLLRRVELAIDEPGLVFAAGSMYWVRAFVIQGLRSLNLSEADFEPEAGQINATTAHALERMIGILAAEAGLGVAEVEPASAGTSDLWRRYEPDTTIRPRARVVPFFLPQFHPVKENDEWWGKGFTEWTNTSAARPVFHGHHQPKIPRDLGYYDLRLDEVRRQQAELATAHGVDGFMYYYYWFAGRRLLERPIEAHLQGDLDLPFSIMWANENWTRRWDGRHTDILIGQDYDHVPAELFIDDVMPFLKDPRYLRVDGRCLLSVYRPGQMDDFPQVVKEWRRRAAEEGIELHVVSVDVAAGFDALEMSVTDAGLDGLMTFPPHNCLWSWLPHEGLGVDPRFTGNLLSYPKLVEDAEHKMGNGTADGSFPGVMVTFDNTARRQWNGDVWFGSNPYTFRRWLASAVGSVVERPLDERIVFVNAWNEWAEGAVLEPSDRFGSTYLLAVRDVVHS